MALDLAEVATNVATATVEYGDITLSVSYRPSVATPARLKAMTTDLSEDTEELDEFVMFMSELLDSWDITDKGAAVGTDAAGISKVPMPILQKVMQTVLAESQNVGEARSSSESG